MTELNTELPRLAPGTYLLTKRLVVKEDGLGEFVDEPEGEYIKGFWPRTRTRVTPIVDEERNLKHEAPRVSMEELKERIGAVVDDYTAGEDYGSGPTRHYLTVGTPDELTERVAAGLFSGMELLFRAVADWQALWDDKEEWEKAAKEAWQRENVLAWLHAEAAWQRNENAKQWAAAQLESERLTTEVEVLHAHWREARMQRDVRGKKVRELAEQNGHLIQDLNEHRVRSATAEAERDALRAQLEGVTATPSPEERAEMLRLINERGVDGLDAEELADDVTQLLRPDGLGCWAEDAVALTNESSIPPPASESVPATPEPAVEHLSVVAHPEADFPDCLTEFARGEVSAYRRAIEECEGWAQDLDRADAAPYWDVARWLEGRVEWFRERATQVQNDVPAAPDGELRGNDADEHLSYEVMPPVVRLKDIVERLEWEATVTGVCPAAQSGRLEVLARDVFHVYRALRTPDEELLLPPSSSADEGNTR